MTETRSIDPHHPETWDLDVWMVSIILAPIGALTGFASEESRLSPGHRVFIGMALLEIALLWHFIHYPSLVMTPADWMGNMLVAGANGASTVVIGVYSAVPAWTVSGGFAGAGLVSIASGVIGQEGDGT